MLFKPTKARTGPAVWLLLGILGLVTALLVWLIVDSVRTVGTLEYEVTPTQVTIVHGGSQEQIDRDEIVAVQVIERPSGARRLFGTSLPGLKAGRWSFTETGHITLYATALSPLVVLETAERKFGVSPEDASGFVTAVEQGMVGTFAPVSVEGGAELVVLIIFLVLSILFILVLVLFLVRLARTLGYELGPDDLVVHGGLRPIRIPYKTITGVEEANPKGYPVRIGGASMPGLYWGRFTWRDVGPRLSLYATRMKPLVIVRTERRTYGLTPEDTEGFLRELERRIPHYR